MQFWDETAGRWMVWSDEKNRCIPSRSKATPPTPEQIARQKVLDELNVWWHMRGFTAALKELTG